MKFSSLVVPGMLVLCAYIYYNHAPEGGWSAMFSECKQCSHHQKYSNQEIARNRAAEALQEAQPATINA